MGTLDTALSVPTLETAESVVNTVVDKLWQFDLDRPDLEKGKVSE